MSKTLVYTERHPSIPEYDSYHLLCLRVSKYSEKLIRLLWAFVDAMYKTNVHRHYTGYGI